MDSTLGSASEHGGTRKRPRETSERGRFLRLWKRARPASPSPVLHESSLVRSIDLNGIALPQLGRPGDGCFDAASRVGPTHWFSLLSLLGYLKEHNSEVELFDRLARSDPYPWVDAGAETTPYLTTDGSGSSPAMSTTNASRREGLHRSDEDLDPLAPCKFFETDITGLGLPVLWSTYDWRSTATADDALLLPLAGVPAVPLEPRERRLSDSSLEEGELRQSPLPFDLSVATDEVAYSPPPASPHCQVLPSPPLRSRTLLTSSSNPPTAPASIRFLPLLELIADRGGRWHDVLELDRDLRGSGRKRALSYVGATSFSNYIEAAVCEGLVLLDPKEGVAWCRLTSRGRKVVRYEDGDFCGLY